MTNLLRETREAIKKSGHTTADVAFVGSADHEYECSWAQFEVIADVEYDNGYGGAEVATDLIVEFTDGKSMSRGEYDGSEWWVYLPPATINNPEDRKPITRIIGGLWEKLAELNQEKTA